MKKKKDSKDKSEGEKFVPSEKRDTESAESASNAAQSQEAAATNKKVPNDLVISLAKSRKENAAKGKHYESDDRTVLDDIAAMVQAGYRCDRVCRQHLAMIKLYYLDAQKRDLEQVDGSAAEEEKHDSPQSSTATPSSASSSTTPWADRDRDEASWWENFAADYKEKAITTK